MIEILASGVTLGVIYALIAVAAVITFNVTGLYDFAIGSVAVIAGLLATSIMAGTGSHLLAVGGAVVIGPILALGTAALVIPAGSRLEPLSVLLLTVGVALVLEGVGVLIWGPERVRFEAFIDGYFEWSFGRVSHYSVIMVLLAVLLAVAMRIYFRHSSIGRVIRANVQDPMTTRLMGARPNVMGFWAFAVSGVIAGMVGYLITPVVGIGYYDGVTLSVMAVVVAIIAGTYSPSGAVAVGIGLGIVEALAAGYLPSGMSKMTSYLILLVVLLLRPQGLFGSPPAKRV